MKARILLALAAVLVLLAGLVALLRTPSGTSVVPAMPATDSVAASSDSAEGLSTPASASDLAESRATVPIDRSKTASSDSARWSAHPIGHGPRLSGVVTTKMDGGPIQSATVNAQLEGETDDQGAHDMSILTDHRGNFAMSMLAAGDWLIMVTAKGHENAFQRVTIVADKEVRADFVLSPVTGMADLVVHLRGSDGRPLLDAVEGPGRDAALVLRPVFVATCLQRDTLLPPGLSVLPIRASGFREAGTDRWFKVTFDEKSTGCCCLVLGDRVLDALPFSASTHDLVLIASLEDLQRAAGSLSCSIVDDATGRPVTANVSVRPAAGSTRHAATDETGKLVVDRLLEGEARIEISAKDHALKSLTTTIQRGAQSDLGVIGLVPNVSISGWVRMPDGAPPWAAVYAFTIDENKRVPTSEVAMARTVSRGEFTFASLPPGSYLIGWQPVSPPELKPVQSGLIQGWKVVDAHSGPIQGVEVVITPTMWESTEKLRAFAEKDRRGH